MPTFRTAKGSIYVVHMDGTTSRSKAARDTPGHEGDVGEKERSAKTIYFSSSAAPLSSAGLAGIGTRGSRVLLKGGQATLVTWSDDRPGWGATNSGRGVPYTLVPAVGLYPLELWKRSDDASEFPGYEVYRGMHAGNQIVEVRDDAGAAGGVPGWYPRYRELRNGLDSGRDLSHAERAELDSLETRLSEEAAGGAKDVSQARQETGRTGTVEAVPDVLATRTEAPELRPNPDLDAVFGVETPPSKTPPPSGGTPPPAPPPPPDVFMGGAGGSGGDKLPPGSPAWADSVTAAFDRPQPVVIVGPYPLPVKMEGGEAGGRQPQPTQGEKQGGGSGGTGGTASHSGAARNQSGSNLSQFLQGTGRAVRRAGGAVRRMFSRGRGAKAAKTKAGGRASPPLRGGGGAKAGGGGLGGGGGGPRAPAGRRCRGACGV